MNLVYCRIMPGGWLEASITTALQPITGRTELPASCGVRRLGDALKSLVT